MARGIRCEACHAEMVRLATKYNELYEALKGKAIRPMLCDGCATVNEISVGQICYAGVVLPNKAHPNYATQAPAMWATTCIKP